MAAADAKLKAKCAREYPDASGASALALYTARAAL
eukprot:CAMPEP_0183338026 /NCGR_PEP_ID=MMETSP0164_2-20130417/5464_1 /TAXON_ID=221442 /ORGANISM="Coccolithus pelagicus ssp braarudi, Strain PLY182g" /LENGTH=34 /DNA_ID= /DNA_START= /DNA_END= /DNA_ORIENTATION=